MRWLVCSLLALLVTGSAFTKTREELGAYYELKRYECEVKEDRFKQRVRERLVILSKRGDDFRYVGTAKPPFAQIRDLKATVYNRAGDKIYERKGKDFARARGFGAAFELYNDMKMYEVECNAPGYPYTIELEYELEFNTLFFWRGGNVQGMLPVDTFDYQLKIRTEVPYRARTGDLVPPPAEKLDGDWKHLRWHVTDVPAFDYEGFLPGINEPAELQFVAGRIELADYEMTDLSWDGIAGWYRQLAKERYLEGAASAPTGPAPAEAVDTIRRLYREVIDNSRYVAVSIGMSGWQPAAAGETEACGYGDCKGLSTLLISRLRLAGIPAYPVLVLTRDMGQIDPTFPEFGFNHLIAVALVGEDTLWLDPTCTTCPFGEIPLMDEDIPVLLISDDGGTIVRTPQSAPEDNLVVNRSRIDILPDGNAEVFTQIEVYGNSAQRLRRIVPQLERGEAEYFYNQLAVNSVPTDLVEHSYENLQEIDRPLVFSLKSRTKRPFHEIDGCRYAGMPLLDDPYRRIMRDFDATLPAADFHYPRLLIDSVTIVDTSTGAVTYTLPDSTELAAPFGSTVMTASAENNSAAIVFKRMNSTYRVMADEYESLKEFNASLRDLARTAIVVCGEE